MGYTSTLLLPFCSFLFLVFTTSSSHADCSCSIGGGISTIGNEFVTNTCPASADSLLYYIDNMIDCTNNRINLHAAYGDKLKSPQELDDFYISKGMRVIRNPAGTHYLIVHPGFSGTVAGLNMANKPAGLYTTDGLNEACTVNSKPNKQQDDNEDSIPDCAQLLKTRRHFGLCSP